MSTRPIACLSLALALLLAGCAGMRVQAPLPPLALFHDTAFAPPSEPVGADDLFALTPAMRDYLHSAEFSAHVREKGQERGLVDALYKKGELKLEYDSAMTRNAGQTYAARAGNCLSLVIMTAAFTKELGMAVRYQNVLAGENWSRDRSLLFFSTHINLSLAKRQREPLRPAYDAADHVLTIDFLPPEDVAGYQTQPLEEAEVVAMHMNNRAVEALARDRIADAYWWARAAVAQYPLSVIGYNTLGVVYQRRSDNALAERVFRAALERQPEHTVVMQNLVPVLAALGKDAESRALAARLASIEPYPPFHFFNLGMKSMASGDYAGARKLFAREVRRAPYYHEFHFWLAIAHWKLGEQAAAREQMRLAIDTSTTRDASSKYSAKLEQLRAQNGARPLAH